MKLEAVAATVKSETLTPHWEFYWQLTKPRLLSMVLISAAVGFCVFASPVNAFGIFAFLMTGTTCVGAGAMALNEWMEWRSDAKMIRTQNRPIPAGQITPAQALAFGAAISILGFSILSIWVNALSALFAFATWFIYLGCYTPLKKVTSLATFPGAVSGALPPLIGWAAAQGTNPVQAAILFAILFFWQVPHFLAIDWMYRDDYKRVDFKTLSVIDSNGQMVARQMIVNMSALFCVSLLPTIFGMAKELYFVGSFLLGITFSWVIMKAVRDLNQRARFVLRGSVVYLTLLLMLMVIDKW
ncbi:MAG: protoheme IX farnesyltransferase [Candidatus Omnitrophica bacterium CG11_big_fil_rev_8_21_14_0_20_45_26]|uniref:Protoheme IX farnesyltransferase n=1 Tax=Candidatus Abzuiibacterium crystallinum TaxID=1974748 RepID=A0A2H0LRP5_9BACT|nr:MAG: protoheme IX farnesyltransferase [Candidatus Omnitrophica bacterium CG11_big_fil_rev_8_21_14_0_20_45_26]PIW65709.1 MAG: protoheme IX farnesyltransferase [Candidatus Omnitrophica bacterium CG12_big_fil_rev_8_21_14_0_65_45_16]